jgi:hypothetical protein
MEVTKDREDMNSHLEFLTISTARDGFEAGITVALLHFPNAFQYTALEKYVRIASVHTSMRRS